MRNKIYFPKKKMFILEGIERISVWEDNRAIRGFKIRINGSTITYHVGINIASEKWKKVITRDI
jgi:hypothetical protein